MFSYPKKLCFLLFVKLESFESFKSNDGLAFLFVLFYTIFFYNLQFLVLSIVKFVFVRFENVYRMCWMSKRCLKDCLITCFCLPFFRSRADLDIDIAVCWDICCPYKVFWSLLITPSQWFCCMSCTSGSALAGVREKLLLLLPTS